MTEYDSVFQQKEVDVLLSAISDPPCFMNTAPYQVGGDHYTKLDVQPWDAMKSWLGTEGFRAYLRGNAVKYLCRAGTKGDVLTDIKKAQHCLIELINTYGE